MSHYVKHLTNTPQSQPMPGRPDMVRNDAGGYAFQATDEQRLQRLLELGTASGTYYVGERELTIENAEVAKRLIARDGRYVVDQVVAARQKPQLKGTTDAQLFVFSLCCAVGVNGFIEPDSERHTATRSYAFSRFNEVIWTASHLLQFMGMIQAWRSVNGRGLQTAVANWYNGRKPEKLALQLIKYRQRDGYTHQDVARLLHIKPESQTVNALLRWAARGDKSSLDVQFGSDREAVAIIEAFEEVQAEGCTLARATELILRHDLPWEAIPQKWLNEPVLWGALLPTLQYTALRRNLNRMTAIGFLKPLSPETRYVVDFLTDRDKIRESKQHPIALLEISKIYEQGYGIEAMRRKNALSWTPVPAVTEALSEAFIMAYDTIEPDDEPMLVGLDMSGSMGATIYGIHTLHAYEAATAMGLYWLKAHRNTHVIGFSDHLQDLGLHAGMSVVDAIAKVNRRRAPSGTDCSLPLQWLLQNDPTISRLVTVTDSESWAGSMHTSEASAQMKRLNPAFRSANIQTTASGTTLNDPTHNWEFEVAGFNADVPTAVMLHLGQAVEAGEYSE